MVGTEEGLFTCVAGPTEGIKKDHDSSGGGVYQEIVSISSHEELCTSRTVFERL